MDSLSQHRTLVRNDVASLKGVRVKLRRHQWSGTLRVQFARFGMKAAKRIRKNSWRWHKQHQRKLDKEDLMRWHKQYQGKLDKVDCMINRFYEKKEKYEAVELKLKEKVKKLKMKIEAGRCVIKNLFFK